VKKILLVDNDEYSLLLISDFLRFNDFHVIATENSRVGLQLAKEEQPDLVICEIDMPGFDGYEFLRQLRSEPNISNIPILFLTFETDIASRRRALQLGANGHITKPVNLNELLTAIASQSQDS
jgi:DNA-binding response OmpR family regulator